MSVYYGPQRPLNVYIPRPGSPVMSMSPVYSPGSYSGSYYDHSPEMRMVPVYTQYAQPIPQRPMIYPQQPMHYNRFMRHNRPCCEECCCCDRCCDECCGPQCCC